jgi:two-component system cell cycle response regulator
MIAARGAGETLSLLVLDLDHFKQINDQHGHDAGDEVLKECANRLRNVVRAVDVVARFGGEEFVIIMPDTEGFAAGRVAERLRQSIETEPFRLQQGRTLHVTASIGVATCAVDCASGDALFKQADAALYDAKKSGRNCVRLAA